MKLYEYNKISYIYIDFTLIALCFYYFQPFRILLFLHSFLDMNHVVLVENFFEIERQADVGFSRKSILFTCYVKELSIHVHCL